MSASVPPWAILSYATAVASPNAVEQIAVEADEVVCVKVPEFFDAVGQFFQDFSQVSDAQVVAILLQSVPKAPRPALRTYHQSSLYATPLRPWERYAVHTQ